MKQLFEQTPGFVRAFWCGDAACEEKVKADTKATIRVIPFDQPASLGRCIACDKPGQFQVLFAKAY